MIAATGTKRPPAKRQRQHADRRGRDSRGDDQDDLPARHDAPRDADRSPAPSSTGIRSSSESSPSNTNSRTRWPSSNSHAAITRSQIDHQQRALGTRPMESEPVNTAARWRSSGDDRRDAEQRRPDEPHDFAVARRTCASGRPSGSAGGPIGRPPASARRAQKTTPPAAAAPSSAPIRRGRRPPRWGCRRPSRSSV